LIGGIIQIIVGAVCVGAGLSGKFVLLGTQSSIPLVVIGAAVAAYGVFRIVRERRERRR
jgi:hypothetical protein